MTVSFLKPPAGIFDLASLSFQVPICGFSAAKLMPNPMRHNTSVRTIDLVFISFLLRNDLVEAQVYASRMGWASIRSQWQNQIKTPAQSASWVGPPPRSVVFLN